MGQIDIWNELISGAENSSGLELFAALAGLLSVWFAKKEKIWLFPIGIISTGIYVYICYEFKLYADMGINGYYTLMGVYGWIYWSKGKTAELTPIRRLAKNEWYFGGSLFALSAITLFYFLSNFTNSDVAIFDSITSSFFIVAMIWMARKRMEHWLAWIAGDILSIPLYIYKGLAFTAFQYLIFTFLAIWGLYSWNKNYLNDKNSRNRS